MAREIKFVMDEDSGSWDIYVNGEWRIAVGNAELARECADSFITDYPGLPTLWWEYVEEENRHLAVYQELSLGIRKVVVGSVWWLLHVEDGQGVCLVTRDFETFAEAKQWAQQWLRDWLFEQEDADLVREVQGGE